VGVYKILYKFIIKFLNVVSYIYICRNMSPLNKYSVLYLYIDFLGVLTFATYLLMLDLNSLHTLH